MTLKVHCIMRDALQKNIEVEQPGDWGYLGGLSELAGRSFTSVEESTGAILRLLSDQLVMRSAFLTRITPVDDRNEVIAAYNAPDGCDIPAGAVFPLAGTF